MNYYELSAFNQLSTISKDTYDEKEKINISLYGYSYSLIRSNAQTLLPVSQVVVKRINDDM